MRDALLWLRRINKVTLTVALVVIAAVLAFAAYGILRLSHAIPSHTQLFHYIYYEDTSFLCNIFRLLI